MEEEEICSRCGKAMGAVIIFDSSVSSGDFCEECHREDMREHNEKKMMREKNDN